MPANPRYLSTQQCAVLHGIGKSTVQKYLSQGRVPGAFRVGRAWLIPVDAKLPDLGSGGRRQHKRP